MYNRLQRKGRLYIVFLFLFLFLLILLIRLGELQVFKSAYFKEIAYNQYKCVIEIAPQRGTIYDRLRRPLAVTLNAFSLYAVPKEINNKADVARRLAPFLDLSEESIALKLDSAASFIWLERKLSPQAAEDIKRLDIAGIGFIKEAKRFYPGGVLAGHIIGFTNIDNQGLEGLEFFYDRYLKGRAGWRFVQRDAKKRALIAIIPPPLPQSSSMPAGSASNKAKAGEKRETKEAELRPLPPLDGFGLALTIDEVIQHIAERELEKAVKKRRAKGGVIIVMDPRSSKILALASNPAFDINYAGEAEADKRRNRAICDLFEPGSVFKFVTAAAVLEESAVDLEDKIYCENGAYRLFGHTLHDHKPHSWLSFREVIGHSSNIGTVKAAQALGEEKLYQYIKLFGFGEETGIDMPGEVSGIIREPQKWSKLSITAIPMGQEIGVTPIQIISALSVIANNGVLLRPRLVSYIEDSKGEIIKSFNTVIVRRVISGETAKKVKDILVEVVENGTGREAQIPGYKVAGKTGTAQKTEPSGAYSHTRFVASFAGFAPAGQPVIAVLVVLDEPRPVYYGGQVAAPVFQKITSEVLRYLEVRPTEL